MKKIPVYNHRTKEHLGDVLIDDEDYPKLARFKWGLDSFKYIRCKEQDIRIHQAVLGKRPECYIHYIDGNRFDARKANLTFLKLKMLDVKQELLIVHWYEDGTYSARQLSKKFKVNKRLIYTTLKRHNCKARCANLLTPLAKLKVCRLYEAGIPIPELAKEFRVSTPTIRETLKKHGISIRPQRILKPEYETALIQMRKQGITIQKLAEQFGMKRGSVSALLWRKGLTKSKRIRSPLTSREIQQINILRNTTGLSLRELAHKFSCDASTIRKHLYAYNNTH